MTDQDERWRNSARRQLHLVWAVPVVLLIWLVTYVLAFITWCGDFGGECLFPDQEAKQAGEAMFTLAVGGLIAGAVMAAAPWSRRWLPRVIAGIVTLGITLATGLLYIEYISR
jgi:small-conductance mechanosensitive channel